MYDVRGSKGPGCHPNNKFGLCESNETRPPLHVFLVVFASTLALCFQVTILTIGLQRNLVTERSTSPHRLSTRILAIQLGEQCWLLRE